MKLFASFLFGICLVGCGAFTNPDGTPMTREQIRAEIHDDLMTGSQVTKTAGDAGVPYATLISAALGIIATAFVSTTGSTKHSATLKEQAAKHSESIQTLTKTIVGEKKIG